jgi:N-acetyl-gamma-glutamyl-phosphate reductase
VVGVSGYAGLELSKILLRHPEASSLTFYVRETNGAHCLTEIFPLLRGWGQAPVRAWSVEAIIKSGAGTAFLATPHEASAEIAPKLLQAGLRVVDLSGAFRFHEKETFERWYKLPTLHAALLNEAGLRPAGIYAQEIAQARIVANPLLRDQCNSGVTASGRCGMDCADSTVVWIANPRDRSRQDCGATCNFRNSTKTSRRTTCFHIVIRRKSPTYRLCESGFSPPICAIWRGIFSTIYVMLSEGKLPNRWRRFSQGVRRPADGAVSGRRNAARAPARGPHQFFTLVCTNASGRRLVIVSCLDNLGKGAAGQAVQNFNHLLGIEEQTGLQ